MCIKLQILLYLTVCLSSAIKCDFLRSPLRGTLIAPNLKSGPIFLLDKRTILVTQFSYDETNINNAGSKWFKAITSQHYNLTVINTDVNLEYDNGDIAKLTPDERIYGSNVILRIPLSGVVDLIDLNEIAIVDENNNRLTSIVIEDDDLVNLPNYSLESIYKNGQFMFVYPKCCPLDSYLGRDDCEELNLQTPINAIRFPIHDVKNGKYDDKEMENIVYVPVYNPPACETVLFENANDITVLSNLEVLMAANINAEMGCMDFYYDSDNVLREAVFVCANNARGFTATMLTPIALFIYTLSKVFIE